MGRPPKPLELHVADGTYRESRHGAAAAVVVSGAMDALDLAAPAHLDDSARAAWGEIVDALDGAGMLRAADALALEALAVAVATMRDAQAAIDRDGLTVKGRFAQDIAHPMITVRDKAAGEVRAWGARFGMTPSDRMSLGMQALAGAKAARSWDDELGENPRAVGGAGE